MRRQKLVVTRTSLSLVCLLALGVSPAAFDVAGTTTLAGKAIGDAVVWIDAPGAPRSAHKAEAVLDQAGHLGGDEPGGLPARRHCGRGISTAESTGGRPFQDGLSDGRKWT